MKEPFIILLQGGMKEDIINPQITQMTQISNLILVKKTWNINVIYLQTKNLCNLRNLWIFDFFYLMHYKQKNLFIGAFSFDFYMVYNHYFIFIINVNRICGQVGHISTFDTSKMTKLPEEYKWSSLPFYLKGKTKLPFKLQWEWILSIFGKRRSIADRKYKEFVHEGIKERRNPGDGATGGWILGREGWVKKVIKKWGDYSSKELSGVKPIKTRIPVADMEKLVCQEFKVEEDELKKTSYNNKARMAIMYLTVNYCGLTLKEAWQRYGEISYSAVGKGVNRFPARITKDPELNKKIKQIMSNVEM